MNTPESSWRSALLAAVCSSSIVLGLGYLFVWAVSR